jgi:hypothetical protein
MSCLRGGEEEYAVRIRGPGKWPAERTYRHMPLAEAVWELEYWAEVEGRRVYMELCRESGPLGLRFGTALVWSEGGV